VHARFPSNAVPIRLHVDPGNPVQHPYGMKKPRSLLFILALLVIGSSASATPFDTMLGRLEKALALLNKADTLTTYVMDTKFEISDGGKKVLQTAEVGERITLAPGQPVRRETLSRKTTGQANDATSGASQKSTNGGSASPWPVIFPVGKDRSSFSFGSERKEGALIAVDFAPAPAAGSVDGITRGTILWDPVTQMPSRLNAVPVRNPRFTSALSLSFTFASADGYAYPSSVSFSVDAGFLFLRRHIDSVIVITGFSRQP
jgi:hypothetical protein